MCVCVCVCVCVCKSLSLSLFLCTHPIPKRGSADIVRSSLVKGRASTRMISNSHLAKRFLQNVRVISRERERDSKRERERERERETEICVTKRKECEWRGETKSKRKSVWTTMRLSWAFWDNSEDSLTSLEHLDGFPSPF